MEQSTLTEVWVCLSCGVQSQVWKCETFAKTNRNHFIELSAFFQHNQIGLMEKKRYESIKFKWFRWIYRNWNWFLTFSHYSSQSISVNISPSSSSFRQKSCLLYTKLQELSMTIIIIIVKLYARHILHKLLRLVTIFFWWIRHQGTFSLTDIHSMFFFFACCCCLGTCASRHNWVALTIEYLMVLTKLQCGRTDTYTHRHTKKRYHTNITAIHNVHISNGSPYTDDF